jgi:hypothetical protein
MRVSHFGSGAVAGSLLALAVTVGGCAGETPQPVAPVAPSAPVAPAVPVVDLAPVPEPEDIVVLARWKDPNTTIGGLTGCAGVPQTLADAEIKRLLDRALGRAFRGGVDGKQIAEDIALDAPVDLVVTLDVGKHGQLGALVAFSIGLSSIERAKAALEGAGALVELMPGYWRVGVKEAGDLTCVVAPSAGNTQARLVCGPHDRDVSALAPYMTHSLPLSPPPPQDVHAEMRFVPVDARYGSELRRILDLLPGLARMQGIGDPRFDTALDEAATALSGEGAALLADLDRMSIDLTVDKAACLTGSASLQFRNKTSWLVNTMLDRIDRAGPPPAIYWRAPLDSASASYGRAVDGARYAPILKALRGLIEGKLAKMQIGSDADRKALVALLNPPIGKDTTYVVASGHGPPPKMVALDGKPTEDQIVDAIASSYLGWTVVGFDEGPATLSKLVKDSVGVWSRKGLVDPLRKALGKDGEVLPSAKLVAAPAQLGKGALDVELHIDLPKKGLDDAKKKPAKGSGMNFHVLLMGEAQRTWLAVGTDRDDLVKHLLASKTGAPDSGTLAARPGLEPLRAGKAMGSGFFTLGAVTHGIAEVLNGPLIPAAASPVVADLAKTLKNLPHQGDTPIFVVSNVTQTGGAQAANSRSDLVLNVQRGSLEDFGAILLTVHRIATSLGLRP